MKRVVEARARGGFRTRPRMRWLRAIVNTVRRTPGTIPAILDDEFDQQRVNDPMHACPHPLHFRERRTDAKLPYLVCGLCGSYLWTAA